MRVIMRILVTFIFVIVLISLLTGCVNTIEETAIYELGNVRKIKLCDNVIYKTCTVVTTKHTIKNLQVSNFPGNDIKFNDFLFYRYIKYSQKISIQYCKNTSCQPYASCYKFMPCYSEYYDKVVLYSKE